MKRNSKSASKAGHHAGLHDGLTRRILLALLFGAVAGLLLRVLPFPDAFESFLIDDVSQIAGKLFINLLRMLVVPLVFVSLVCGCSALNSAAKLGRIGIKTVVWYLLTTMLAVTLALLFASIFHIGDGLQVQSNIPFVPGKVPSIKEMIIDIVPINPVNAMATGNMLQLIVFSLFFGAAIMMSGKLGDKVRDVFAAANDVMMHLVAIVMSLAPYGIFFLIASVFARQGMDVLIELFQYFIVVLFVFILHLFISYGLIIKFIGGLNPIIFFKKMSSAALFAFGVSSSNASIPVVLETVEEELGVDESVASFVIPLGATINMDGTAIMQGVATVFIANAYHAHIGLTGYLTVILMATLSSIGTAGVPSVGLITLSMVLHQLGLPVEGVALIISVDRLLDMMRTAVNVTGDAMVACLVAKSERLFDKKIFEK